MFALINWRLWAALALAAALVASHWKAYTAGEGAITQAWNAERLATAQAQANAEQLSRATERALQDQADQTRRTKDARIAKISADLDGALATIRLFHATPRPRGGETAAPAGAEPVCTGTGLFTEDAEFLVREAARADRLAAAYGECRAFYDAARETSLTR